MLTTIEALNDGRTVRIPFYTREKIGDSYVYHYEIVNSSPDFYNDQVFLNQIDNLSKLAVQESDNSFFNDLSKIENTNGQRDSIAEEIQGVAQDIDPDTGLTIPRTNATFVRVWLNSTYYNQTVDPSVVDQNITQTKKEVFDLAKEDIAIKNYASKPETKEPTDKYPCTPSDFQSINGTISEDTIKCRLKYTSINNLRNSLKLQELRDRMDLVNDYRNVLTKVNKTSVVGFAKVEGNSEPYKAISGERNDTSNGFALLPSQTEPSFNSQLQTNDDIKYDDIFDMNGNPTDPNGNYGNKDFYYDSQNNATNTARVFRPVVISLAKITNDKQTGEIISILPNQIISFRGNDTEHKLLEAIATDYFKNTQQNTNIELFTDRATCLGCQTLIRRINAGNEKTGSLFKVRTDVEQGIYHTLNSDGSSFTEKIEKHLIKNYYNNLDLNSVR